MIVGRAARDRRHARLLESARRGDSQAFRRLYRELYGPLWGYVSRRVARREDAEDLVAEVFHRFVTHLDDFDRNRGSVISWLLVVAHHAVADHYRRASRTAGPEEGLDTLVAARPSPLEEILADERAGRLRRAVAELSPETRELLSLRFDDQLRYGEIGALTGMTEAAVKQRCSRAVRALRDRLAGEEELHGP